MNKVIASLLLVFLASEGSFIRQANAEACPPKYRFVDFGRESSDGVIRRGGTIFRAFDAGGTLLLVPEGTTCRAVEEMSKDGRLLPIPVVTGIAIDLEVAGPDVSDLRLTALADVAAAAERNAALHRDRLTQTGTITTRGTSFLCAAVPENDTVSCQLVSPYEGNAALVVYCDAQRCQMPVLVRDPQLSISAIWRRGASDPEALGPEITEKIQRIHDFFEDQI